MARARINKRLAKLIDQCSFLIHTTELTAEQVAHINKLMAWTGQFAARCKLNPFRTVGLSEPTDSIRDIEEEANQRLEAVGKVKLIALDLERFPAVCALTEFLEHRIGLDLQALRAYHEAGTLETYAAWHRRHWSGVLADLVPSHSVAPAGVQAQAGSGMKPFGGLSKWDA